jgi:glucose/arabinose dehydrogenase
MRRPAPELSIAVLVLILVAFSACGASGSPSADSTAATAAKRAGVGLKRVGNFESPVYVTAAPGYPRLLFVVEQGGRIEVLKGGRRLPAPFLDVSTLISTGGERGLLSVAFPPDYRGSGRFYVYYTARNGDIHVDEFHRRSPTRAAPGSRRGVIRIRHRVNANHNGGQLQFFGDLLYFGTGDGGSGGDPPNNAQNKDRLLGKLLRIDPRPSGGRPYSVPSSNPFVGPTGGRDEIYSYGLRNPFRFSFDTVSSPTPRIVIGDVGQNQIEEIDYTTLGAAAGANFGWDAFEGDAPYTEENSGTPDPGGTVKPIFDYPHSRGGSCSVIGGYVVADPKLRALYKRYVYADLCEGELRVLTPHPGGASGEHELGIAVSSPSSFGEDDQHRLYVASLDGPVYRLVPR